MSYDELKEKRERGLCYNCNQKWCRNHRCRNKHLLLLGTDEEEDPTLEEDHNVAVLDKTIVEDILSLNTLFERILHGP